MNELEQILYDTHGEIMFLELDWEYNGKTKKEIKKHAELKKQERELRSYLGLTGHTDYSKFILKCARSNM